ncbi:hypothetical protein OIU84_018843 [Salix udensis]|uniref:Malectin-like domain-containing protein n=1 Tax=Salix udensis TaxID=889485 RepID=A0AAD6PIQ7_9ROSI|nr:hypothetical protein OIU84_018843 [Salix udensis]
MSILSVLGTSLVIRILTPPSLLEKATLSKMKTPYQAYHPFTIQLESIRKYPVICLISLKLVPTLSAFISFHLASKRLILLMLCSMCLLQIFHFYQILVSENSSTEFPVIKEFFLTIVEGNFDIYFIPADETRFAFVNAIEAFLLPPNFFIDSLTSIPPLRTKDGALRTLYRINVGGPEVYDTLWRNWVPDDDYLTSGSSEQVSYDGELQESRQRLVVKEIAPDAVYRTCKKVSIDNNGPSNFTSITWRFNVSKEARHLVRLHVCDFFSPSPGTVKFDLNISTNFSQVIDPNSDGYSEMRIPLFYDYVVSSDDSGYMSFSIAPKENSIKKVAFLNGLEIMEFVGNWTFEVPVEHETRKHLAFKIGSTKDVALILILILLLSICLRLRRLKPVKALILENEFLYGGGRSPTSTTERTENASIVTNLNLKLKMSLAEILAATENFNPKLLIGEGGFAKVYKGTLESGSNIGILFPWSAIAMKDWR